MQLEAKKQQGWAKRHNFAIDHQKGTENVINILRAIEAYACEHHRQQGRTVGNDYYFGPIFEDMLSNFRQLLSGDLGRLDGATIDSAVFQLAKEHDLDLD